MKKKTLAAIIGVICFVALVVILSNPDKFGIGFDKNETTGQTIPTLSWNPVEILIWVLILMVVGIGLYAVFSVLYSITKHKGTAGIFGFLFKKDEIKTLCQTKRIQKCRDFTIKFMHGIIHKEIPEKELELLASDNNGNTLHDVEIRPSSIRKDATPWELYIWKWGHHKIGFRDIPGKADNKPHKLYYMLQNCSNGECFPIAIQEYGEGGKLLNQIWLGGWKKMEESEFMRSMREDFMTGMARKKGEQAAEKSEEKEGEKE